MNRPLITLLFIIIFSCNSVTKIENNSTLKDSLSNNLTNTDTLSESITDSINNAEKELIVSDTLIEFQNNVFEFGSRIHLKECTFIFECDCCYGDFIFKPDFTFYYVDHCMSDITVTRGVYSLEDNYLMINSDSIKVQELYNWENEVDTSAVDFIVSDSIIKPYKIKFAIQSCDSTIKLIDTEDPTYVAIKTARKANSELKILECKGIVKRFKHLEKKK